MDFFFYGTLIDEDVLASVIGRRTALSQRAAATLPDHVRMRRRGGTYPVIVRRPGGCVDGVVVCNLRDPDVRRLAAFEGTAYRLDRVCVFGANGKAAQAHVFRPVSETIASSTPWSFSTWRAQSRRSFLARTRMRMDALKSGG